MKLYTVKIGTVGYRIRAGSAAQAVKMAIDARWNGKDEPKEIDLTVKATAVPPIEQFDPTQT